MAKLDQYLDHILDQPMTYQFYIHHIYSIILDALYLQDNRHILADGIYASSKKPNPICDKKRKLQQHEIDFNHMQSLNRSMHL